MGLGILLVVGLVAVALIGGVGFLEQRDKTKALDKAVRERAIAYTDRLRRADATGYFQHMTPAEMKDHVAQNIRIFRNKTRARRRMIAFGLIPAAAVCIYFLTQNGPLGLAIASLASGATLFGVNEVLKRYTRREFLKLGLDTRQLRID